MSLRSEAREITGAAGDHDALLELVGEARFVLLGGASHGTHEFYRERSRITRRLIAERGFCAVAIVISTRPARSSRSISVGRRPTRMGSTRCRLHSIPSRPGVRILRS
jgi:hypothetical protein